MQAKVLAIANQKGGVGKTTTTVTLGAALARMKKKVLIIDLDPHACASVHLRFFPDTVQRTTYDLFTAPRKVWPLLWKQLIGRKEGQYFDTAPASIRLSELEVDLKEKHGKGSLLKAALEEVRDQYDYILLDCPPQLGMLQVNAIVACDLLIIPIQTDFLALHGLKLLFDTLRTLNKVLPKPVTYRALATMYDKRAGACRRVLDLLGRKMGDLMFSTVIGVDTRFRDASALGKSVYEIDASSRGARGYELLAKEVESLW